MWRNSEMLLLHSWFTHISGCLPSSHCHRTVLLPAFLLLDAMWRHHALSRAGTCL